MANLKDFAEQLVNLSVKDVNELATILKEEHGIEPAAAAVAIVQEKIMAKLNEEIKDLKSAAGIIKPSLNKLDRALSNMRNKLNQSIKDKEQADTAKQERNKMLGKEE